MGWFSKKSKGAGDPDGAEDAFESSAVIDVADPNFDGRPVARPLTDDEQQRIASALDALADRGVDVDDLSSIGAAYDASCAAQEAGGQGEARDACELFGIAIGEHLHRHSTLKWAIVTDAFGTDLGLAAARSETVVVPHNLVSARWMRRETGWIPRVVDHLLTINARR
jgi:hypothetical protein